MKLIGLTGGIASGKSTVARMFSDLGAHIVDADAIARRVTRPGCPAYQEIVGYFGHTILDERGEIDREKLGTLVFSDDRARKVLEDITHPRIGDELQKEISMHRTQGAEYLLIDAPLLVEAGMHSWLRPFIVVSISPDVQIDRLIKRNGMGREEAVKRIHAQMPLEEKVKLSDYVIDNSGDLQETHRQVVSVWENISGLKRS